MEKINLAIDVGNTNIVFGFFRGDELFHSFRLETDVDTDYNEYYEDIQYYSKKSLVNQSDVRKVALSSVNPSLSDVFERLSNKKLKKSKFIEVTPFTNLEMKFPVEDPGYIGSDLIVNAFAAKEIYKENCIICDFGTATTFQLVGKDGFFFGTIIAPGIKTAAYSLFKNAALLEKIELENPNNILGTSTKDAILSGIVTGNAVMTDGIIDRIKTKYTELLNIKTIATGGLSSLIYNNSNEIDIMDEHLTLKGLNLICNRI